MAYSIKNFSYINRGYSRVNFMQFALNIIYINDLWDGDNLKYSYNPYFMINVYYEEYHRALPDPVCISNGTISKLQK